MLYHLFYCCCLFAAVSAQAGPWDAALVLHSNETASSLAAYCLDGSKGGFYYRAATSPSAKTKWKIHFMGGGWCNSERDCLSRSNSLLGSSQYWTPWLSNLWGNSAGFYGLMSLNATSVNPFGDWNFIWLTCAFISAQCGER